MHLMTSPHLLETLLDECVSGRISAHKCKSQGDDRTDEAKSSSCKVEGRATSRVRLCSASAP